jgi:probable F420-dependent oxidoreductase
MEFDVCAFSRPLDDLPALAREVEELGCSGMWFTESSHNPLLGTAVASTATSQLTLGTGIALAFPRSPMVTAQAAWDLAQATDGRFILGLGTQVKAHMERRFSVPYGQPARRLREYVHALRAIFRAFQGQERLAFKGDFYSFSLLTDFFNPGPIDHPDVPISIAGVNARMARTAGEICDGFHVHPFHTQKYLDEVIIPSVGEGATSAGRTRSDVALTVGVFAIVLEEDEQVVARQRDAARRQLAFYGSTPAYRSVFDVHGLGGKTAELHALQAKGDIEGMTSVFTDDILDHFAVTASWDDLADALLDRYRGRADRLFIYGPPGDWRRSPEIAERWRALASDIRMN